MTGRRAQEVGDIQRARLLKAASDTVAEIGYSRMTVAEIISRARVSRKTFYQAFDDREDCFLALFELTLAHAATVTVGEYRSRREWRAMLRSALGSLLVLMEREPALARLWVVEALKGGEGVLARRAQVLEQLALVIDGVRSESDGAFGPPGVIAEGLVGGVVEILHTRLTTVPGEPLVDLLGPLMYMIVLPYLGRRAAQSELNRPVPPTAELVVTGPAGDHEDDPLDGLKMRLTQRTSLVLLAIGQFPGANNCQVAEAAGVVDQGQISKMLGRLAGFELVENHGKGHEHGAPNAWKLTERGMRVVGSTGRGRLLSYSEPLQRRYANLPQELSRNGDVIAAGEVKRSS
jgi:AcrR family transcriptional regulator